MRKTIILAVVVILCASVAFTQETSKAEVFGGYQYTSLDLKGLADRQSANGWNTDVAFHLNKNFSIVGDISGAYKTETISTGAVVLAGTQSATPNPMVIPSSVEGKVHVYNYLFGPRVSFSTSKITPFVEALFGMNHTNLSVSVSGVSGSISSNNFGMALGGGLDYNVSKHLSIRLGKFDYMLNRVKFDSSAAGVNISENLNNFRYATGVVFKF